MPRDTYEPRTLTPDELARARRRHRDRYGDAWSKPRANVDVETILAEAARTEQDRRRARPKRKRAS